jgi:hypothetical protein
MDGKRCQGVDWIKMAQYGVQMGLCGHSNKALGSILWITDR